MINGCFWNNFRIKSCQIENCLCVYEHLYGFWEYIINFVRFPVVSQRTLKRYGQCNVDSTSDLVWVLKSNSTIRHYAMQIMLGKMPFKIIAHWVMCWKWHYTRQCDCPIHLVWAIISSAEIAAAAAAAAQKALEVVVAMFGSQTTLLQDNKSYSTSSSLKKLFIECMWIEWTIVIIIIYVETNWFPHRIPVYSAGFVCILRPKHSLYRYRIWDAGNWLGLHVRLYAHKSNENKSAHKHPPPPLPHTYLTMHDLTHSTLYHILCDIHYGCRLCLFTGTKTAPFTHYRIRDGTSESTHFPTASCYFRQQLSSFFTLAHKRIAWVSDFHSRWP